MEIKNPLILSCLVCFVTCHRIYIFLTVNYGMLAKKMITTSYKFVYSSELRKELLSS